MTENESDNLILNRHRSPIRSFESSSSCSSSGCSKLTKATLIRANSLKLGSFEKSCENLLMLKSDNIFCLSNFFDDVRQSSPKRLPGKKLAKTSSLVSQTDLKNIDRKQVKKYLNYNLECLDLKIDLPKSIVQYQKIISFKKFTPKNFSSILLSSPSSTSSSSSSSSASSLFSNQAHVQKITKHSQTLQVFRQAKSSSSSHDLKSKTILYEKMVSINCHGVLKPVSVSSAHLSPSKSVSSFYSSDFTSDEKKLPQSDFKVISSLIIFF